MKYYVLKDRKVIETECSTEWLENLKDTKVRHLAEDRMGDDTVVSTIFIGAHPDLTGKNILFETVIFSRNQEIDGKSYLSNTYDEALIKHKEVTENIRGKLGQDVSF